MNEYKVTQQQLEQIEHYQRMFELEASNIEGLCLEERPDVNIGFVLGKTHSHLRDCFAGMMELESEIRSQIILKDE